MDDSIIEPRVGATAERGKPGVTERHPHGPRAIAALLPRITRAAYRRRAPATAELAADWATIVGPNLARSTAPRRLAAGTLTIACAGPVALELQHLSGELLARLCGYFGRAAVGRLRFVQEPIQEEPSAEGEWLPNPLQAGLRQSSAIESSVLERALADLPAGELRDKLLALGRAVTVPAAAKSP